MLPEGPAPSPLHVRAQAEGLEMMGVNTSPEPWAHRPTLLQGRRTHTAAFEPPGIILVGNECDRSWREGKGDCLEEGVLQSYLEEDMEWSRWRACWGCGGNCRAKSSVPRVSKA